MHTVRTVEAAMPYLEASDAASVIAISSVSGREIDFVPFPYGALKASIVHYTAGLAQTLAAKGIRANAVSPATPTSRAGCGRRSKPACPTCSPPPWR